MGTVTLAKVKKRNMRKAVIPAAITYSGKKYKVTAIGEKAFQNCKKLRSVTIGKNVKTVGKSAFRNCTRLEKVAIQSTVLKKVGKQAFRNVSKKVTIQMPKKKTKAYTKMLRKAGISR